MVELDKIQSITCVAMSRRSKISAWAYYGEFTTKSDMLNSKPFSFYVEENGLIISDNEQLSIFAERKHVSREMMSELKKQIDDSQYKYAQLVQNPTYIEVQAIIHNDSEFEEALREYLNLCQEYSNVLLEEFPS